MSETLSTKSYEFDVLEAGRAYFIFTGDGKLAHAWDNVAAAGYVEAILAAARTF